MAEPTISERLRRLHHLCLAEANALAVADLVDADRLTRRIARLIHVENVAIEAAAARRGCAPEEVTRINGALDVLRSEARYEVRLRIAQSAFREAEKSNTIVPKSGLVETRGWLRQAADQSKHEVQQAIRTILAVVQPETEEVN
jgi:AraC-like DNA-binding protein